MTEPDPDTTDRDPLVVDGHTADGDPVFRRLSEIQAEIDADEEAQQS